MSNIQEQSNLRKVSKLVVFDLTTVDSNAFVLMGKFQELARRQRIPTDEINAVINECQSDDYNHLVATLLENTTVEYKEGDEDNE